MTEKYTPLDSISAQIETHKAPQKLPPVDQWNPPLTGDLDMQIKRDGSWFYLGTPILRKELVRLFSTILKREGDDYFLVTPVEKFRIQVEDAPFLVVSVQETNRNGEPVLAFETLTGDIVVADADHPLRVDVDQATGEPSPYVRVRSNLDALIARPVFYQLVDGAALEEQGGVTRLSVRSAGQRFVLGDL